MTMRRTEWMAMKMGFHPNPGHVVFSSDVTGLIFWVHSEHVRLSFWSFPHLWLSGYMA
jgi:hypothetical protein